MSTEIWTVRSILQWTAQWLGKYDVDSPRLDGELLLAYALKVERIQLFLDPDRPLIPEELSQFKALIKRRAAREPVAYILGERAFLHWNLKVTPGVLIPRPETEHLVQSCIEHFAQAERSPESILDMGVGSGAIILALMDHFSEARGVGVDISPDALACARVNGERLGLNGRMRWFESDYGAAVPAGERFDLITSNPPYISKADLAELEPDVRDWEPTLALDGGEDGLDAYRVLIPQAVERLNSAGLLAVEIGYDQGEAVFGMMQGAGLKGVRVIKDYSEHDRVVMAFL
uniref:Release factor glutamine methyltransferase n=1 Tax=Magnetococcus massalia (strain MO-1) TaxID=451514 RepID=A0A1S7LML9_MAGMO|nr:Protein hemK homolog [Candidatus Magnetococcus massalia]